MRHFLRTAVRVVSPVLVPSALSAGGALLCADSSRNICPIRLHFIYYIILQVFFSFVKGFFVFFLWQTGQLFPLCADVFFEKPVGTQNEIYS
jgi:hypothetical protein